jgi:phospholipid/cholesterol/gamma-HCH transport system substrate-binding protein
MKWSVEAKVGLVTVIGVILFTYVALSLAHTAVFGKPGYIVHALFADANGIKEGNSVRYVGVHVGRVEDVAATKDGVNITLKLDKGTEIPKDSQIAIGTDGLLGEKMVTITPGKDTGHLLSEGDYLYGAAGQTMSDMMDNATQLMGGIQSVVGNLNAVIGDPRTQAAMRGTLQNTEALTANLNRMAESNSANLQSITSNLASLSGSLNGAASQLQQSAQNMDGDGTMSQNMRGTVTNMKSITDNIDKIARSMANVATDPQSSADIKTTLHNTAQISGKLNNILGGKGKLGVQGEAGMLYNDTQSHHDASVNFKLYRNDSFAIVGAEYIGNGTNLNLQYGRQHHGFDYRLGLINGDMGAGLDFGINSPFQVSLEGYDPDDWRYRIRARYRIMPNIYLVGQFTRPMNREDGGNYYGVNYTF